MQQSLPDGNVESGGGAASSTVRSLMEKNIIPVDTFVQTFLHTIITGTEHKDCQVADTWVGCLLEVMPLLPFEVLQSNVTPNVIKKTHHENPLHQRVSSCKIIGALCRKYPESTLKRELLPLVLSLCQDVSPEVRAEMSRHLHVVFGCLRSGGGGGGGSGGGGGGGSGGGGGGCQSQVEQLLIPLLVDLAAEDISIVKEAALLAIIHSLHLFSSDSVQTTILPLLKQLFDFALNADYRVLLTVAENFEQILQGLNAHALQENVYFLTYFISIFEKATDKRHWLSKSDFSESPPSSVIIPFETAVSIRKHCALSLSAVLKLTWTENEEQKTLHSLHDIFKSLVSDHYWDVRKVVAETFSQILKSYGNHALLLKEEFLRLLKDDSEDVLSGLVPQLGWIFVHMAKLNAFSNELQMSSYSCLLIDALKQCEEKLLISLNWRLHSAYMQQMEVIWYIFPPNIVYDNFVLVYLERIFVLRVLPLRLSYVRTLLINAKFSPNPMYRSTVKRKLLELSTDSSFYNRMLYLKACDIIIEVHSTSYFKKNFYMATLKLSDDRVANIRWAVCRLLPQLRAILSLPQDQSLLETFIAAVQKFEQDSDREVKIMLNNVKNALEHPDEEIFHGDKTKEAEENMLAALSGKLSRNFPYSVVHVFNPLLTEPNCSTMNSLESDLLLNPDESTFKEAKFDDDNFMVDTGVQLKSFSKSSKNALGNLSHTQPNNGAKMSMTVVESKLPIKKNIFRPSIPVRKESISLSKPVLVTQEGNSQEKVTIRKSKIPDFDRRKSQNTRSNPEKRYSLDVTSTCKMSNLDSISNLDSFEVNNHIGGDNSQIIKNKDTVTKTEITDINKNVTCSGNSPVNNVQRRKKSQLPRPLSCVLPAKTNPTGKNTAPSKLPVMRRP